VVWDITGAGRMEKGEKEHEVGKNDTQNMVVTFEMVTNAANCRRFHDETNLKAKIF